MANRADPLSRTAPGLPWFVISLVALTLAETVGLCWYWTVPLPNADRARTTLPDGTIRETSVRRWHILAQSVPQFIDGITWRQSHLGHAAEMLSHVEHLPQRLPIVAAGLLLVAAAAGCGLCALRFLQLEAMLRTLERLVLGFVLGSALLGTLTLIAGRFALLTPWSVRAALVTLAVSAVWLGRPRRVPGDNTQGRLVGWLLPLSVAAALPFLIAMILASMQPTIEFDSLEYHLQGPKEWYLAGRIAFLPHNVYTSMPFNVEMLHLLGMQAMSDWWQGALVGQFVVMFQSIAAALAIGLAATRLADARAGVFASLVYLSTPWIYRLSVFPYVEGPLSAYHAALLLMSVVVIRAEPARERTRLWGLLGALAGGAMACKYPAFLSAVVPFGMWAGFEAVKRRTWLLPAAYVLGVGITLGPWLVKNVADHGNPVYPLANRVFHGHPWSDAREQQWSAAHGARPATWPALIDGLTEVAGRNDWQSPLYLALVPLALLRPDTRRAALVLLSYATYIFAVWWLLTHRLDRFWLPLLPALAILAGLGADWSRRLGWRLVLGAIVAASLYSNWIYITTPLAGLNQWTDDLQSLRRDVPRIASPTLAALDDALPPHSKVLLVGQAGVFHMKHEKIYNTVFDEEQIELMCRGRSAAEILAALHTRGVTHILVDWSEIERHRKPGGYGFSPYVTRELFDRLKAEGVIASVAIPQAGKQLYRVL